MISMVNSTRYLKTKKKKTPQILHQILHNVFQKIEEKEISIHVMMPGLSSHQNQTKEYKN